jgi:hypothetical protein
MLGQEIEKKGKVAAIGGDGMRRSAAFAREPRTPQPDGRAQIVRGGKSRKRHRLRE